MARFDDYRIAIAKVPDLIGKGGELVSSARLRVDAAGDCQSPVGFEHAARTAADVAPSRVFITSGDGRCRQCAACRRYRSRMWAGRAMRETTSALRTWFGTLTLGPEARMVTLAQARRDVRGSTLSGDEYDEMDPMERTRRMCRVLAPELARYLKRLRAESGCRLRYMLVHEQHRDGTPHMHCLVHEYAGHVRERTLSSQWRLGFSQWRLVKQEDGNWKHANYVCKYLAKDALTRVRASFAYGNPPPLVVVPLQPQRLTVVPHHDLQSLASEATREPMTPDAPGAIKDCPKQGAE